MVYGKLQSIFKFFKGMKSLGYCKISICGYSYLDSWILVFIYGPRGY